MLKMNRLEWANPFACRVPQNRNQEHGFSIQSHKGILYGRRSGSIRRLYSTA